jgi:antirestriction protein ArdC
MKALDIVMNDRKKLVEEIIKRMEKQGLEWKKDWTPEMLLPKNPSSNVIYKGRNVLKTFHASLVNEYNDPRWVTFKQAQDEGWKIKPGAKSIILEKWIFEKEEKQKNPETGIEEKVKVKLDTPIPNYFRVFNANDVEGIPPLNLKPLEKTETLKIAEDFIKSSKIPIIETAQPDAFYTPSKDKILIPLKETFKSQESYLATVLHEMVHSTGKELNRDISNNFGSEKYAKEELVAELGAMMLQGKLGIKLEDTHIDNHGAYLQSWIKVLKNDFNELFKASIEAEKASELLYNRYLEHSKEKIINKTTDNEYWRIEFNERSNGLKSYADLKLTKELLEEIKKLDNELYQKNEGIYKFYFEHIKNNEVIDKGRIDVGTRDIESFKYLEDKLNELEKENVWANKLAKDMGNNLEVATTSNNSWANKLAKDNLQLTLGK